MPPVHCTDMLLMVKGSDVFWASSSFPRRHRIWVPWGFFEKIVYISKGINKA